MDKRDEAKWSESRLHLSSDSGTSIFASSFDISPHTSYMDSSYPAPESISGFAHSGQAFSHAASTSGSYDSLPASMSTGHIYEISSNDSSGLSGSVFTDPLGSSSATSSLMGTGQDSLSDVPSRKASLSSIHDGPLPNHLVHSPEFDDTSAIAAAAGWPSNSTSVVQPNSTYGFRCSNASSAGSESVLTPASFYNSTPIAAGPSQSVNPYAYSETMRLITPGSLSSLQMNGTTTSLHQPSQTSSTLTTAANKFSSQPLYASEDDAAATAALQNLKYKSGRKSTSSTSGSTRRAKFRRSRTGCMVCRKRKVKCDQDGQPCKQCRIGKRDCHYEENPQKRKRKSKSESDCTRKSNGSSEDMDTASIDVSLEDASTSGQVFHTEPTQSGSGFAEEREITLPKVDSTEDEARLAEEDARRAREEAIELRRTTDALFAQHTNFDDVEGNDEEQDEELKAKMELANDSAHLTKVEDGVDTFTLQYTNDDDTSTAPWTSRSNLGASMTAADDWSTLSPSTGPPSNETRDGNGAQREIAFDSMTDDDISSSVALEDKTRFDSPFHKYVGLEEDQTHDTSTVISDVVGGEEMTWYHGNQSAPSETTIDAALEIADGLLNHA